MGCEGKGRLSLSRREIALPQGGLLRQVALPRVLTPCLELVVQLQGKAHVGLTPLFGLLFRPFLLRGLPPRLPGLEERPLVLRCGGVVPRLPPLGDGVRFRVPPGERELERDLRGLLLFTGLLPSLRSRLRFRVPPGDLDGFLLPLLSRLPEALRRPRLPAGEFPRLGVLDFTAGAPVPLFGRCGKVQFFPRVHFPF